MFYVFFNWSQPILSDYRPEIKFSKMAIAFLIGVIVLYGRNFYKVYRMNKNVDEESELEESLLDDDDYFEDPTSSNQYEASDDDNLIADVNTE